MLRHRRIHQAAFLHDQMRNVLCNRIALQPLGSAFPAVPAFLDAAEWRLCDRSDEMVDGEIAGLYALRQPIGIARRPCESIGGKPAGSAFAFSSASSSDWTGLMSAIGPNGSSRIARASSGTSASTVMG
jgi:hypothetical protein